MIVIIRRNSGDYSTDYYWSIYSYNITIPFYAYILTLIKVELIKRIGDQYKNGHIWMDVRLLINTN